jgi:hypothetical protein
VVEEPRCGGAVIGNTQEAIDFLLAYNPHGLWVLTAIEPGSRAIQTRTFDASRIEACRAWIDEFQGTRNIYFHVNEVVGELTKKAERRTNQGDDVLARGH